MEGERTRDHNAGGFALDLTGVLLEKAFVPVVAGKIKLLVLIQLAGVEYVHMSNVGGPSRVPVTT